MAFVKHKVQPSHHRFLCYKNSFHEFFNGWKAVELKNFTNEDYENSRKNEQFGFLVEKDKVYLIWHWVVIYEIHINCFKWYVMKFFHRNLGSDFIRKFMSCVAFIPSMKIHKQRKKNSILVYSKISITQTHTRIYKIWPSKKYGNHLPNFF